MKEQMRNKLTAMSVRLSLIWNLMKDFWNLHSGLTCFLQNEQLENKLSKKEKDFKLLKSQFQVECKY